MCVKQLRLWLRNWSSSLSAILKDNKQVFPMWYSEAVEELIQKDDTNNWIRYGFHALPPVHLPISEQESLIEIETSGSVNILFNHISGLGCAQSILPWQIALLKHWCPLQPRTCVRVDSRPSIAWKLNTGTDCVWEMKILLSVAWSYKSSLSVHTSRVVTKTHTHSYAK